jgi:hypothetical protein
MSTLYLSAPKTQAQQGGAFYRPFQQILATGVGPDYGISAGDIAQIQAAGAGVKVVVFDRDQGLQAEGVFHHCTPKAKAGNGVQRYDVYTRGFTAVRYTKPPHVSRFGVLFIPWCLVRSPFARFLREIENRGYQRYFPRCGARATVCPWPPPRPSTAACSVK